MEQRTCPSQHSSRAACRPWWWPLSHLWSLSAPWCGLSSGVSTRDPPTPVAHPGRAGELPSRGQQMNWRQGTHCGTSLWCLSAHTAGREAHRALPWPSALLSAGLRRHRSGHWPLLPHTALQGGAFPVAKPNGNKFSPRVNYGLIFIFMD